MAGFGCHRPMTVFVRSLSVGAILFGVSLLLWRPTAIAQAPPPTAEQQVVDVRIVGNLTTPTSKVLHEIGTRPGRPFDQTTLERDVRKLATQGWFLDVKTRREAAPGGVIITFEVVERPTLQYVRYLGNNSVKDKSLAKQTELKKGDSLDPYAVEEGRRKIEAYYQQKGYSNVRVTIMEGNKLGDRGAIFVIHEGQPQKVWTVRFIGNTIASDARLKTQIRSKPPLFLLFKGHVDRKQIDEDVEALTNYYRGLGFFRARIGRELEFDEDREWLTLTFVIDEGPRYKVREVSFIGNTKFSGEQLARDLKLTQGNFFDQSKMTSDLASVQDAYGSVGHIFAEVNAEPRFLEEPGTLDLVYNIQEGDRYRVGKIKVRIEGENPHTRHNTVLNRVSLKPGDIVDIRELRASERRLKASGLFETNPTKGTPPKIVFSPPEDDGVPRSIAGNRGPAGNFRGQSPDGPPDRVIDIHLVYPGSSP